MLPRAHAVAVLHTAPLLPQAVSPGAGAHRTVMEAMLHGRMPRLPPYLSLEQRYTNSIHSWNTSCFEGNLLDSMLSCIQSMYYDKTKYMFRKYVLFHIGTLIKTDDYYFNRI